MEIGPKRQKRCRIGSKNAILGLLYVNTAIEIPGQARNDNIRSQICDLILIINELGNIKT